MFRWIILKPLSFLYALAVTTRNFMFDHGILKSTSFDTPLISVGNITVGGTGKTPMIEYIIQLLKDEHQIAVLSRGYKRKTKGFVLAVDKSSANEIGDEPAQIKAKFPSVDVAVDGNRVEGVKKLLQIKQDYDAILLDDAYQHRYVSPDLSILLIDYNQNILEDYHLPFGRLRESAHGRDRAHIIVVTKCPEILKPIDKRIIASNLKLFPYQTLYFSGTKYGKIKTLFEIEEFPLKEEICIREKYSVLLVSGIANSDLFYEHVQSICEDVVRMDFSDHHQYSKRDIAKIEKEFEQITNTKKIIITTEKDAMRFLSLESMDSIIKQKMYYIPITTFFKGEEDNFINQIINYVRKDKTNYKFHKTTRQF